ncbi:MAG: rhomboid family intramembrane serine protease [Ferruginibacter sp.]
MSFTHAPITFLLIAANILFSIIGFYNAGFLTKTIGWPYYSKRNKEYYRFISSGFLHADWMHLFFNMFTLFFFGQNLEIIFNLCFTGGGYLYLLLYFAGLIAADLPSYFKHQNDQNYRSLGASGAVSAVVFASILFDPWSQLALYGFIKMSALIFAVVYVVYCIYMGKQNQDNVNHDAHLWGSVFGLLFTLILVAVFRSDLFAYILQDLQNPSLTGRREIGAVLQYLLYGE